jgi:hypothetical protein
MLHDSSTKSKQIKMNRITLDLARKEPHKSHVQHLTKPEAIAFGESGVANLNVHYINEQIGRILVPQSLQYYPTDDMKYIMTSYYATVTLVVEFVSDGKDPNKHFLSSAVAVSPLYFVATAHGLYPPSDDYQLRSIYYTYLKDVSICSDMEDNNAYGKLQLVSKTEEIDKSFPGYAVAGQFEWNVCQNDIAVLMVEKKPEMVDDFVLLPKPCTERRLEHSRNEVVVSGCAALVSKEEYENNYDPDHRLVEVVSYESINSYFYNFDKTVMSIGSTTQVTFPSDRQKRLATHTASALGGMSGGPVTVLDVLPITGRDRRFKTKRTKFMIPIKELPKVAYFSGLHLGGFPNFGKNVALPVDDPSFIWTYCTYVIFPSIDTDWYRNVKEQLDNYLNYHMQFIQTEIPELASKLWPEANKEQ